MKRAKSGYTYAEAHNKAVNAYQKSIMVLFWVGILNIGGAIIGTISDAYHFLPSLASNMMIFHWLLKLTDIVIINKLFIVFVSILFAAVLSLLWSLAKKGNKYAFFTGIGIYLVDTILVILFLIDEPVFIAQIIIHAIVIILLIMGIGAYNSIYSIEKKYKNHKN